MVSYFLIYEDMNDLMSSFHVISRRFSFQNGFTSSRGGNRFLDYSWEITILPAWYFSGPRILIFAHWVFAKGCTSNALKYWQWMTFITVTILSICHALFRSFGMVFLPSIYFHWPFYLSILILAFQSSLVGRMTCCKHKVSNCSVFHKLLRVSNLKAALNFLLSKLCVVFEWERDLCTELRCSRF